jgi:DNA-binding NtrC family response regulator
MAKVMLIDDDVDLIEMNRAVLRARGHEIVAAYSAGEARKLLAAGGEPCDVVVLDIMMETPDAGIELGREIHRMFPRLPIIVVSGIQAATGRKFRFDPAAAELPVYKFLDKPVSPGALADEVRAAIEGAK